MSQQLEQKLGVRSIDLTRKSSLMLPQTRKIADNLHTEIIVDSKWADAEGKAYIISQEALSSDYTKSVILQETTDQQLVAMETVHPSNEDVYKQFKRDRRTSKDYEITMYPMYLLMIVLVILYSILIYKTGIKKVPIIIESSQWLDIFLVSVIFVIAEGFIHYWIGTQMIDKTIFKSYSLPLSKTFEIRHNGKLQSISTTYFTGMFFTLDTASSKKVFGYSPSELEEYMKIEEDIQIQSKGKDGNEEKTRYVKGEAYVKIINDAIANKLRYEKTIVDAYQVYQMKKYELDNIEAEFVSNMHEETDGIVSQSEIKERKENDKNIQQRKEELETLEKNYKSIRDEYYPRWETERDLIESLQNKYMEKLEEILGKAKDQKAREMLVNSEKHIMTLKHKVSVYTNRLVRITNLLQNAYDEGLTRSDEVLEHVYSIVQETGANKYEISYRIQDQNGSERVATANGNSNGHSTNGTSQSSYNLDLTPVVKIAAFVAGAVVMIYAIGWLIPTILGAFGGVTVLGVVAIFATMFLILIIGWSVMRSVNLFSDSANNRTTLGFK